ncbi:MAG: FtsX-like permease family protein [Bacilli bacterium]|nr:FtsX-like permease family protein [Bacilli bacterium]MBR4179035.1 FtsX-like permease family protein [Bacilli bacterium]MBR4672113.1 FtsX-like permease family protein [Bacilli bacterium]
MLKRKMFRDIRKNLSQFITIFLMIMIGIMAYSGIKAYMDGMQKTANRFYSENNLQDLNVIGYLNYDDLNKIKKLDNVKDAELKLSVTATTDNDKTLLLNFIESNNISKFYIYEGEEFDANKSGIWLDNFYCEENDINVGDIVLVKYDGMVLYEKVLGKINVPDHLYDTRDESELYPDRKEFGFAYMSVNEITEDYIKSIAMKEASIADEKVFDIVMPNFNYKDHIPFSSVMVDVEDKNNKDNVKENIEDNVSNAKAIINIEDTSSYVSYQGEIDEGKTYVGVFSGIFLFIAMLSVITTMTRVVKNQRVQIGTLKALGFSNNRILLHYIGYGFWISVFASLVGLVLGYFLIGNIFINLEMEFFEIPNGAPSMNISSYCVSVGVILVVALITYITGRSILKENPAETLRTKIPSVSGKTIGITKRGFFKKLSFSSKWNVRDILRNKMRTFMGLAGVVGCCALIVCALGMLDSMNFFVKLQFEDLYNFDYKLNLKENLSNNELQDLYDKYGSNTSQSLGIEIKDIDGKREANNILVTDAGNYLRFVDNKNKIKEKPSDDGVYVTYKLASNKGYKLGDEITWHIYGDSKYYSSKIIGFNKDPQNQNVSMTRKYLENLGITYQPDSLYTNIDLSNTKEIKNVETIQNIDNLKDGMTGMLSMMKTMLILIIGIAVLLGGIIIYNLGILSYTEKEYQFATLKVLGFKDNQIKNIFIKQNNWIAVVSIIFGLPIGYYLTDWLFKTAIEEHYDFGAFIETKTYIISAIGTFIVSYLVSRFLARKIKKIDMVTSLKGNE